MRYLHEYEYAQSRRRKAYLVGVFLRWRRDAKYIATLRNTQT